MGGWWPIGDPPPRRYSYPIGVAQPSCDPADLKCVCGCNTRVGWVVCCGGCGWGAHARSCTTAVSLRIRPMHLSLVRAVDCAPHNRPETCFANDHQCGQGASRTARKHPPGQQKSSHEKLAAKAAGFGDPQICNERIWGITFGPCRRPRGSSAWTPRCLGIAAWRAGRPGKHTAPKTAQTGRPHQYVLTH